MCQQQHIHYQEHPKQSHKIQMSWTCSLSLANTSQCWLPAVQTRESSSQFSAFGKWTLQLKIASFWSHLQIHPSAILFLIQTHSSTNLSFGSPNPEPLKMIILCLTTVSNTFYTPQVLDISATECSLSVWYYFFFSLQKEDNYITDITPEQNVVTVQLQQKVQLSSFQAPHAQNKCRCTHIQRLRQHTETDLDGSFSSLEKRRRSNIS